jgi:adenylate cyclase
MSLGLEKLTPCFQGILPAMLFTSAQDGTPNAAFLSHVDYVDATHVALSFQFFNKSRRNIAENPHALVRVIDPDTNQGYAMRLKFERSETSGPIFDRMFLRIEAIASYVGLKGIFKLKAADIYLVESVELVPEEPGRQERWSPRGRRKLDPVFTMKALQELSARMTMAGSLNELLESILSGIKEYFGFSHSMILLAGEKPNTLITIASRGYPQGGIGAEVQFGEGIIGVSAEARQPIRISGLVRGMLYALAVKKRAEDRGWRPQEDVKLPGLENPSSQLGVPLVVRGDLVGVLCIESETPYRFHEDDKNTIELLGASLAIAIQNMQLKEAGDEPSPSPAPAAAARPVAGGPTKRIKRELAYYSRDEVVMLDGEYLVRSLPARILWKLLQTHKREGRAEFTNRELRLDKSLNLPDFKDNLETRLLLLRRRLDEKADDIRIVPISRGRFALEINCAIELVEK